MKKTLILIAFILVICFLFSSCAKTHLTKEEISALVKSQQELLKQTPAEVQKFGYQAVFVSSTEKDKNPVSLNGIQGLYLGASMESADGKKNGDIIPLKNEHFSALMQLDGLISLQGIHTEKRWYVQFSCGKEDLGRGSETYYGFYYTEDAQPVGWNGEEVEFDKSGEGLMWKDSGRGFTFYTEKIMDHWFYYEAYF